MTGRPTGKSTRGRVSRVIGWGLFGFGVLAIAVALPLAIADDRVIPGYLTPVGLVVSAVGLLWLATGAAIVSRQPRNWAGWTFCAIGLTISLGLAVQSLAVYGLKVRPGSVPLIGVLAWVNEFILYPVALVPLLFLLFPDGRPPSRRWRWATVGLLTGTGVAIVGFFVRPGAFNNLRNYVEYQNPFGIAALHGIADVAIGVGTITALASSVASVFGLRYRFKRSLGDERQQLRWLVAVASAAAALLVLTFVVSIVGHSIHGPGSNSGPPIFPILGGLTASVIAFGVPGAYGIAIMKYRLYDLDLVIRKTVVFGLLAVFITLVYAAVVAGVGALIGSKANTVASFAAAALLAVLFQPARDRARRFADRLVFGKRATPYEVLAEFSGRMSETYATEDVLPRMAEILRAGAGASTARVWLRVGGELRPEAEAGDPTPTSAIALPGDAMPEIAGEHAVEVRHQGELLGALSLTMPANDPMNPAKDQLVRDLAAQAGSVLRNVRLIEELRSSRQRLVAAQDEERRKIERNLHDGAQQQLVALSVKLRLAEGLAERDPEKAKAAIADLQTNAGEALENLRDLARGIYPPLLADRGLAEALAAQARKSAVPTTVDADGIGRYSPEVEATVYFCTLEALQNVAKYAEATRATIGLRATDDRLIFEVNDDGRGFDPASTGYGTGLQGIADRLDSIGGTLGLRSSPGAGTTVIGTVPV